MEITQRNEGNQTTHKSLKGHWTVTPSTSLSYGKPRCFELLFLEHDSEEMRPASISVRFTRAEATALVSALTNYLAMEG